MQPKHQLLLGFLLLCGLANAQELVKDINPAPESQIASETDFSVRCKPCGNYIYFIGRDKDHGQQLWRTDGTPEGTLRITGDANEFGGATLNAFPLSTTCLNDVFYVGYAGLWKTSGVPHDLQKVDGGTSPVTFHDQVAFTGNDELRITSGATNSSTLINKFETEEGEDGIAITGLRATDDHIYIVTTHFSGGVVTTNKLWASDGVTTQVVFTSDRTIVPELIVPVGDKLYFVGYDNDHGWEVWASDGTPEGTVMTVEAIPGANDDAPAVVGSAMGKAIIASRLSPITTWMSEGTPETTEVLFNDFAVNYLQVFHDKIYYSGNTLSGANLMVQRTNTDFTGAEEVVPEYAQTTWGGYFSVAGDKLLYGYDDPTVGTELYSIDENDFTLSLIADINEAAPSSGPRSFAGLGIKSVFLAEDFDHGFEYWVTDGTPEGTMMLQDIASGTQSPEMSEVYQYNRKLYFIAKNSNGPDRQLWTSDGTEGGTYPIFEDPALSKDMLFGVNNYVITTANGFVKIDVDAEDSTPLTLPDGYTNYVEIHAQPQLNIGDVVFFNTAAGPSPTETGGLELWKADVSSNEISFVKDINPGPEGSVIYADRPKFNGMGVVLNDKIIFPAVTADGMEPWVSDGTEEGTIQLKNIRGSGDSFPRSFMVVDDKVYFIALSDEEGTELWVTDGTPEGTNLVKDIAPGPIDGILSEPLSFYADLVFFTATTTGDAADLKIWASDGTGEGTQEYENLLPNGWKVTQNPVASGDFMYFLATHPDYGNELWSSDGTPIGTTLIELVPGEGGSPSIDNFISVDGTLYFSTHGKIWRTLGDTESTAFLGEANPVGELLITNDYLCFQLNDETYGKELFRVSLTGPVGQLITFSGFTNLEPGHEYDIAVNASSGLPVTLESSDPTIIEISGNKIIVHRAGSVVFTATQTGDTDFKLTVEKLTVVVDALPQTITFEVIGNKTMLDESFSVVASSSSELPLIFETSDETIATISEEGEISIIKAGTVTITASQEGNEVYEAAEPVSRTFTISKVAQTITFAAIDSKVIGSGSFNISASASSALPVTFTFTAGKVNITGTTVELLQTGQVTITAQQAGNNVYNAADVVSRTFCINPEKPTITQTSVGAKITLTSSANTNIWLLNNTELTFTGKSFDAAQEGFYKAAAVADGCQGEFSDAIDVVITGFEETSTLSIYPSPVKDRLFVSRPAHLRLVDVSGRELINETVSESINVSSFTPGMYILIVNHTQRLKVLKQ